MVFLQGAAQEDPNEPQKLELNLAGFLRTGASSCPDSICVEMPTVCYTFKQLFHMAARIAEILQRTLKLIAEDSLRKLATECSKVDGEPPFHGRRLDEHIIIVALERGAECIASVHAVMMARCAYCAFDVSEPAEKLVSWFTVSRAPVLLTCKSVFANLNLTHLSHLSSSPEVLDVLAILAEPRRGEWVFEESYDLDRLAYVIFTSGSTGKPKAVMIQHKSACNIVKVFSNFIGLQSSDRFVQLSSMSFDVHVLDVFCPIRARGTTVLMPDLIKKSGAEALHFLAEHRISAMSSTPSLLRLMSDGGREDVSLNALPHLRLLDCGAEALGLDIVKSWAPGRQLFNSYGPTEVAVVCSGCEIRVGDDVTIGHDLPSYRNLILDPQGLQQSADGVSGVLFTAGIGLARGYLEDAEKTAMKFVEVPGQGRMYNTGDLALRHPGSLLIYYQGRVDWQVKVRGLRVELERLEEAIRSVAGVKHCEARVAENATKLVVLVSGNCSMDAIKRAAALLGNAYQLSGVQCVGDSAWKFNSSGKLVRGYVPLNSEATPAVLTPRTRTKSQSALFDSSNASPLELTIANCISPFTLTTKMWNKKSNLITDLSIDSMGFGKIITRLHEHPELAGVDLRMLFASLTVESICREVEASQLQHRDTKRYSLIEDKVVLARKSDELGTDAWPKLCFLVQSLVILLRLVLAEMINAILWLVVIPLTTDFTAALVAGITFLLMKPLLKLLVLVILKWLLIGRYTPGDYPIYGLYFLKHWCVDMASEVLDLGKNGQAPCHNFLLGRNAFHNLMLRSLGAQVCISSLISTRVRGYDLVQVGPLATVLGPCPLSAITYHGKVMSIRPLRIGQAASVAWHSCVVPGAKVQDGGCVEPLSSVPPRVVCKGRACGVPACQLEPLELQTAEKTDVGKACRQFNRWSSVALACSMVSKLLSTTLQVITVEGVYLGVLSLAGAGTVDEPVDVTDWLPPKIRTDLFFTAMAALVGFGSVMVPLLLSVLICRLLPKVAVPLDVPLCSLKGQSVALKCWMASKSSFKLQDASAQAMFWRFCGAQVGKGSLMAENTFLPEALRIGSGCFFATNNLLTSLDLRKGRLLLPNVTSIGDGTFVGNRNCITASLPERSCIGLRTLMQQPSVESLSNGTSYGYFGNPAMRFARLSSGNGAGNDDPPSCCSAWRFHFQTSVINVFLWDMIKAQEGVVVMFICTENSFIPDAFVWQLLLVSLMFVLVRLIFWVIFAVGLANFFMHSMLPRESPHMSSTVANWYTAQCLRRVFTEPFYTNGTPWAAAVMRLFGARVGLGVFSASGTQSLIDPHFSTVGDDVTFDYDAAFQLHSFEDMKLKWQPKHIERGSTILQFGLAFMSDVGENVVLGYNSTTWKGQALTSATFYQGTPAAAKAWTDAPSRWTEPCSSPLDRE